MPEHTGTKWDDTLPNDWDDAPNTPPRTESGRENITLNKEEDGKYTLKPLLATHTEKDEKIVTDAVVDTDDPDTVNPPFWA